MIKRVTIHDIAKQAGASSATVSRVLSNSDYPVSAKLKEKIQQTAKEMNYIPNMIGKQLKTDNNMTIGVIIPSISNPFYASVMLGIEEVARKNGYQVLLCNSLQNPKFEDEYLKSLFEKQVKGLIISSISSNKDLLQHLMKLGLKVVAFDQKIELDDVYQIEFDYQQGAYLAVQHLLQHGHERIAYITAPLNRPSRVGIFKGYQSALRELGGVMDERYIQVAHEESELDQGLYEFSNGKKKTKQLLESIPKDEWPTAIFTCNDLTAFGVINELSAHGIQVPKDMSVVGFDDIELSQMVNPPLTTVKQPDYDMGKMSCRLLLNMLKGENLSDMELTFLPKLINRESVEFYPPQE